MYTVIIETVTVITGESTQLQAVLKCEVYGYPRDTSPPVWTHGSDELHNGRYTTTVTNAGLLSGNSISTTERVVSQLTITNVTANDSGDYTCSWQGNSTTVTLRIAIIIGESIYSACVWYMIKGSYSALPPTPAWIICAIDTKCEQFILCVCFLQYIL